MFFLFVWSPLPQSHRSCPLSVQCEIEVEQLIAKERGGRRYEERSEAHRERNHGNGTGTILVIPLGKCHAHTHKHTWHWNKNPYTNTLRSIAILNLWRPGLRSGLCAGEVLRLPAVPASRRMGLLHHDDPDVLDPEPRLHRPEPVAEQLDQRLCGILQHDIPRLEEGHPRRRVWRSGSGAG